MTPQEMMRRLVEPRIPEYLDEGAVRVMEKARINWPSTAHPENIWARDRSVGQFSASGGGDGQRVIENAADYSGYTDGGYTAKGAATAKPWAQRGSTDYLRQTAEAEVEREAQALLDHIIGGLSG